MLKFKEASKNSYSNLREKDNRNCDIKVQLRQDGKMVIFKSKYAEPIKKFIDSGHNNAGIELEESEWQY